MKLKVEKQKGWTEAIIDDDCGYEKFYKSADLLEKNFNLTFTKKRDDFDTLFWDFKYLGSKLTLHYNIYLGVSVFPTEFKDATQTDNEHVAKLGALLFEKLFGLAWSDFEDGKTIGTIGSESGTIIKDVENSNGARVTLEKVCGDIPFAITIGIYGLLFHTHYESDLTTAHEYIENTKFRINKIFDLYETPKDKQDEHWRSKHDRQIYELAEMNETTITSEEKPAASSTLPKAGRSWWQKLFGS